MSINKILGIIGGLLTVAGVFLPISSGSDITMMVTEETRIVAYIFIALGALGLLLGFMGKGRAVMVFGLLALALYIWIVIEAGGAMGSFGIGFYLVGLGALLMTIAGFMRQPSASTASPSM